MSGPKHRPVGRGQHFLRSSSLARELVAHAAIGGDDLVWEIGAGTGLLTRPLAVRARHVTAIEIDRGLRVHLERRVATLRNVTVVVADAREVHAPEVPYRLFGNLPFAITTEVLRRFLGDVDGHLVRADVIVQLELARKRAAVWPSSALSVSLMPWWDLALTRRLPARAFTPPPKVDAAVLRVLRRESPLLDARDRQAFTQFATRAFRRSPAPIPRAVDGLSPRVWKRFADDRGIPLRAVPRELDVYDWVALYEEVGGPAR